MAVAPAVYLDDKSALARLRNPAVASALGPLLAGGRVATCGILELEILFSARSHSDFIAIRGELRGYPRLAVSQSDFDRAIDVLGMRAAWGQHRAGALPDLLLAAVAERHGSVLLHYDAHFDLIAAVTGQSAQWVVERGSVP